MLVKFSCGCIGFAPDEDGHAWLIKDCTREADDFEYAVFRRDVSDKTFEPVDAMDADVHIRKLARLIHDGNTFREVKRLLS